MTEIEAIAERLMEPVTMPPHCPPLTDRILAAIDQLVAERTAARTDAHDMATEVMRLTRERDEWRGKADALMEIVNTFAEDEMTRAAADITTALLAAARRKETGR